MPDTYGKTWWREGYACGCMIQSIEDVVEPRLRAAGHLGASQNINIFQQAYSSSVSASAGTHAGGGSLDHAKGNDAETIIWRECGWADWQRGPDQDYAFDDHNHGIVQGCPHLSGDAASQVDQYEAGCNGLADWGSDQSPYVKPITWQAAYDKYCGNIEKGLLGMSEMEKWTRTKDRGIAADGEWHLILIDDEDNSSMAFGPCLFIAWVSLEVTGLAFGDDPLQVRFGTVDDKNPDDTSKRTLYPIQEIFGSQGTTFGQTVFTNTIPDNTRLRLYVNTPRQVTVTKVTARCLHD